MRTSLAVVLALAFVTAAEAGGGEVAWEPDAALALEKAQMEGRPILLYFTVADSPIDRAVDAGAFSDEGVVEAAKGYMCVYLAWDDSPFQTKLRHALHVTGAPSVVFATSSGEFIDRLSSIDPREAETQILEVSGALARTRVLRSLPGGEGAPWNWIRERIEDLGSEDYETRQRAADDLGRLADSLRASIQAAKSSLDPEVAARAKALEGERHASSGASDSVTVDVVVDWLQKGVKDFWIIRKIHDKGWTFTLTDADLKQLKDAGAREELLDAMQGTEGR